MYSSRRFVHKALAFVLCGFSPDVGITAKECGIWQSTAKKIVIGHYQLFRALDGP